MWNFRTPGINRKHQEFHEIKFKKILHKTSGIRWQFSQGQQRQEKIQQNFQNSKGIYNNVKVRIISTENTSFRCKDRIDTFSEIQVFTTFIFWKEAMVCPQIKELNQESRNRYEEPGIRRIHKKGEKKSQQLFGKSDHRKKASGK